MSVLRLAKAAFTFAAGADYLAWKISRHSGIEVKLKPWQRRHPVLGALVSRRIPGWILSTTFGALLALVAVYTLVRAVVAA